ncbi:MAG: hypothetical protein KF718_16475 [Polyangiaceae bacterium]|nr:hypothetical protein [Polyangiaceae bacterium]
MAVRWARVLGAAVVAGAALAPPVAAQPQALEVATAQGRPKGWADRHSSVQSDVLGGKPFVVQVFVPLCADSRGGKCGKHKGAGDPTNLDDNLYWGAIWGARRYLQRGYLGWQVESAATEQGELERLVLKRNAPGRRWGASSSTVEQIVVLHAIDGESYQEAMDRFRERASGGGVVTFGGRTETVHVVGYMGRNPLLRNGKVPKEIDLPTPSRSANAIPSFSIAAHSRETLAPWLAGTGSSAMVLARGPIASEAYILDTILKGLGDNHPTYEIWNETAKTYRKHHRHVNHDLATLYFAPYIPKKFLDAR